MPYEYTVQGNIRSFYDTLADYLKNSFEKVNESLDIHKAMTYRQSWLTLAEKIC